jgi:hypothetical protein
MLLLLFFILQVVQDIYGEVIYGTDKSMFKVCPFLPSSCMGHYFETRIYQKLMRMLTMMCVKLLDLGQLVEFKFTFELKKSNINCLEQLLHVLG